ncbi:MAG TPA: radical SAM protein, partial [Thermoanaerobaculia bacterium]|nr:radical SAM protein [Thermoanaerobaculia bacterium]
MTAASRPGAYVHIPFCAHRCAYCSFVALEGRSLEADYFDALGREVVARRGETEGRLDTVYFGGGTPSYVDPKGLASVLSALRETFGLDAAAEVTAEANPDDIDEERLASLAALG